MKKESLTCPSCGFMWQVFSKPDKLKQEETYCRDCGMAIIVDHENSTVKLGPLAVRINVTSHIGPVKELIMIGLKKKLNSEHEYNFPVNGDSILLVDNNRHIISEIRGVLDYYELKYEIGGTAR